jgi:predicted PurR-regulated permease PerM
MSESYPTMWQKKVIWSAVTFVAVTVIGCLAVAFIVGLGRILGFLQPLLIPVAVAGILAYLMNPLVDMIVNRGVQRLRAVLYVFALVFIPFALIALWVLPEIYQQSLDFARDLPSYIEKGKVAFSSLLQNYQQQYGDNLYVRQGIDWVQQQIPLLPPRIWNFFTGGVQGFLGAFGFLLGLVVVPIYLFFFLLHAGSIAEKWSDYLPIRASAFKDELVDCLNEINSYLIAFFRGQILVTLIDGAIIGVALLLLGIKFALVIGLMVAVLQLIPFVGVIICWIPAVLIAVAQSHDWVLPFWVTVVFFLVTNLDGLLIAPRIVGNSVGLHPMTIIVSVFAWSLLIGGLLGALLAVPLTATLKVLLHRYIWRRQFGATRLATTQSDTVVISVSSTDSTSGKSETPGV